MASSTTTTTNNNPTPLPILIIGSGLGGLLLAQGLLAADIPFAIYERDAAPSARPQGYRIRISGDGIAALEATLPPAVFRRFEETCAQVKLLGVGPGGAAIDARTGREVEDAEGAVYKPSPAHVKRMQQAQRRRPYTPDRAAARRVLMEGGVGERVCWGKAFEGYDVVDDEEEEGRKIVIARFADGSTAKGCLLVGADGARSRVRRQFLGDALRPVDTRGRIVYGKTALTAEVEERMPEGLLDAMRLVEERGRADGAPVTCLYEPIRFPQRGEVEGCPDEDYVYWVLVSRKEVFGVEDDALARISSEEAKELALEVTKEWNPQLRALFELADPTQTAAMRVLSMRPEMAAWEPLMEPVTLLGDAAHVMSPSGGVGAVTAFRDAANLAKMLVENRGQVSAEIIGKYETMMKGYAKEAIEESRQGGVRFFNHPPFEECMSVDA